MYQHPWNYGKLNPYDKSLLNLQDQARRAMNVAERKLKEKTEALLEATEALSSVLEHLIHRLEDFTGGSDLPSKALKYFNDHKYRLIQLLQYLKTRNYVDFLSVLPIYQKTPLPTALLSTSDLSCDVSVMNQL